MVRPASSYFGYGRIREVQPSDSESKTNFIDVGLEAFSAPHHSDGFEQAQIAALLIARFPLQAGGESFILASNADPNGGKR
jgi:hypothetical protein